MQNKWRPAVRKADVEALPLEGHAVGSLRGVLGQANRDRAGTCTADARLVEPVPRLRIDDGDSDPGVHHAVRRGVRLGRRAQEELDRVLPVLPDDNAGIVAEVLVPDPRRRGFAVGVRLVQHVERIGESLEQESRLRGALRSRHQPRVRVKGTRRLAHLHGQRLRDVGRPRLPV